MQQVEDKASPLVRRNNVRFFGEGETTFLLAHGFGCDQSMWRHIAGPLSTYGKVVVFDQVGAGAADASAYTPAKYSALDGYARDVIEICDALGLKDVIFIGHSVAATIGILSANARPDLFSRLILICASPRYAHATDYAGGFAEGDIDELLDLMDKNHLEWTKLMAPLVIGGQQPEVQEDWRASVCRTDPVIAKLFARLTFSADHRDDYQRVTTPTLLIDCSEDVLAPPVVGRYVHAVIEGSERIILTAAGHCPHLTVPGAVIAAIATVVGPQLMPEAA